MDQRERAHASIAMAAASSCATTVRALASSRASLSATQPTTSWTERGGPVLLLQSRSAYRYGRSRTAVGAAMPDYMARCVPSIDPVPCAPTSETTVHSLVAAAVCTALVGPRGVVRVHAVSV